MIKVMGSMLLCLLEKARGMDAMGEVQVIIRNQILKSHSKDGTSKFEANMCSMPDSVKRVPAT